jgi:hypothetical protein
MKTQPLVKVSFLTLLGLVAIVGPAFPEAVLASDNDPNLRVTIQIYNYSQASPTVLAGAEREAGRILGEAGLQAVWLECPVGPSTAYPQGPCQKAPEPTDIRLRVLAAPIQNKFKDNVFGFTIHPVLASVYYDYVVRRAKSDDVEFEVPTILGCAIAHELGHLLLGPNGHSAGGIMQGEWEPKQFHLALMGGLVFTSQQSKVLRTAARARTERQRGNLTSMSLAPEN